MISITDLLGHVTWEVSPAIKNPRHRFVSYFKIILALDLGFAVITFQMSQI